MARDIFDNFNCCELAGILGRKKCKSLFLQIFLTVHCQKCPKILFTLLVITFEKCEIKIFKSPYFLEKCDSNAVELVA
jgi:hypothetical protein